MPSTQLAESTSPPLAPVAPESRVGTLDLLRGFAMFGVLWSNLNDWYWTADPTNALDRSLSWIQNWLVDSRFYSLLGFLFGIGFAIQLQRAEARDSNARDIFLRRMLTLLAFGLIHGILIWRGDILTQYALLGFLLVFYRRLSQRGLAVATAATYFLVPYVLGRLVALFGIIDLLGLRGSGYLKGAPEVYGKGTYGQVVAVRIHDFLYQYGRVFFFTVAIYFLVLFLLGMWAVRAGLLYKLTDKRWLWRALAVAVLCVAAGLLWNHYAQALWTLPKQRPSGWRDPSFWYPRAVFYDFGQDLLLWGNSAAYASALALLWLHAAWRRILTPLAAVGRMPLTTYLTQSVVCTTLFYGYGFGLWGRVGFTGMLSITVVVFSLQMIASVYWLRHFRFGPAEWLWRSLAYARSQPMKPLPSAAVEIS